MAVSEERTVTSSHVSDPALVPFLQPRFDPADYLNGTLSSLALSSRPIKAGTSASLADLSTQTQDLLSQLNAHTTRLSAILTQLTDDILRSGARLAYEVEVLRGETLGLTETLTDGLKDHVKKFLPCGILLGTEQAEEEVKSPALATDTPGDDSQMRGSLQEAREDTTPGYISDLRTLTTVRSRLESVIKVFGEAMHWTIPPSDISLTSSLISVSAPEPGSDNASREKKGKDFAASLRSEIADLMAGDQDNGIHSAEVRIKALRDLAQVWKGTAEEKARMKFVEGLAKLAEDRQTQLERERQRDRSQQRPNRSESIPKPQHPAQQQQRTGGFLENLQRIRGFVESEFE